MAELATITIVIPTKNAGLEFRDTLAAIRRQTLKSEIIVVDSGSSDQTLELACQFGAQTVSIAPGSFNHGETRNLGIRRGTGQFCIMLVQDAVPFGETWLETLIAPFSDERVVGVTGRHVAGTNSDPVGRWQVEYQSNFLGEEKRLRELENWDTFLTLSFEERLRLVSFDNVCSALRRDFWERFPFRPLPFAEDLDWGVRAIAAGYRLVYDPAIQVIHSHTRSPAYHLRRGYISKRVVPKLLQVRPTDPGIRCDDELFAVLGFLCGEVQTMLAEDITDWRKFSESRLWESFLWEAMVRKPSPSSRLNAVRGSFYHILECLDGMRDKDGGGPRFTSVVVPALSLAIGSFIASYYNWCEEQGALSVGMRRLDRALSQGV